MEIVSQIEVVRNRMGFTVMDGDNLVIAYTKGTRGGDWTASGYFNEERYAVIKNNGKILAEAVEFGTINAKNYKPVIVDAYIDEVDNQLKVVVVRQTRRWGHKFHWTVVRR